MAHRNKVSHKGNRRHFSTMEELQQQMNRAKLNNDEESEEDDQESEEEDEQPKKTAKPKGVSDLIEIQNPNRNPRPVAGDEVQLSRREREEIQKQQARERYQKLHAEGKTEQAKADLARLEVIRREREEAKRKKEMEQKAKEEAAKAKAKK